jgi:hypothetical protein
MYKNLDIKMISIFCGLGILEMGCGTTENETPDSPKDTSSPNEDPQVDEPPIEDTPEPNTEPENSFICSPQPNNQMAKLGLDLFEKAMTLEEQGCYLDLLESDVGSDGQIDDSQTFQHPTELLCDDQDNCEQELGGFAWAWSQPHEYDYDIMSRYDDIYEGVAQGRRIIQDGKETIEIILSAQVSGSTADRRVERIYNTSGNLLSETYYFADSRWFEVNNQWENDQLVEQNFSDYINASGYHANLTWNYDDDGRMITSTYTNLDGNFTGREHRANFSYNAEGQLIEAQRILDDEVWLTQNWTYESGELTSRNNTFSSDYIWLIGADDFMIQMTFDYMSHWDQSLNSVQGDCTQPPNSLFHGYPDAEVIYRLGWSVKDVPDRIGFAYNYNGYGWMYGDLSWFGHGGIASFYGIEYGSTESEVTSTMQYENGIMVEEVIEFYTRFASLFLKKEKPLC